MYKPELSAGKAGLIGGIMGFGMTTAGSPVIPTIVGATAAGIGMAVANRKDKKQYEAKTRQAHEALSKQQFKTQADWAKDL